LYKKHSRLVNRRNQFLRLNHCAIVINTVTDSLRADLREKLS